MRESSAVKISAGALSRSWSPPRAAPRPDEVKQTARDGCVYCAEQQCLLDPRQMACGPSGQGGSIYDHRFTLGPFG